MRRIVATFLLVLIGVAADAQIAGNAVYGGQPSGAQKSSRPSDDPPTLNSVFLEASVLMNVRADTYVASFALSEVGESVAKARSKAMDRLGRFTRDVSSWNTRRRVKADYIGSNRV